MKIKYIGHSCFYIESIKGKRIIFDPFPDSLGYDKIKEKADLVLISHGHFDHNSIKDIEKPFMVIRKKGNHKACGIEIYGISSFHDKNKGELRGKNNVYYLTIDGIRIAHFGDIGDISRDFPQCDIAFIPIGGFYTIDTKEALELAEKIDAKLFFPMHYKTRFVDFPIAGIDEILKDERTEILNSDIFEVSKDMLPKKTKIIIFNKFR